MPSTPVAVTGATGHIGANLVRALLAAGARVRALVRDDVRALEGLPVEPVRGDVLAPETLPPLVSGAEVVIHLAGRISISGDPGGMVVRTNVEGARNVAAASRAAGARRLLHVSSVHAYTGHPLDVAVDESRPLADLDPDPSPYDRSKAIGQREVLAAAGGGLEVVALNPVAVIGPDDHKGSRTGRLLAALAAGRMPALMAGGFSWVDARDVAGALVAASTRGRSGEAYLLPGHWRSVAALAAAVHAAGGARPPRLVTPWWLARAGAPLVEAWSRLTGSEPLYTSESMDTVRKHRVVRGEKAARELGWAPRPFEETIRDTLAWIHMHAEWT
jgi:dihydroflavonol-4-reductase